MKISGNHLERLALLASRRGIPAGSLGKEYGAALYLLSFDPQIYNKIITYVDRDGIDFPAICRRKVFSDGERAIVRLAGNLFNGSFPGQATPATLVDVLDDQFFQAAMTAVLIRRYGLKILHEDDTA